MRIKLPNGKMLVIGLIDTKNIVIGLNSNSFFSSDKRDRHILMLDYDAIPFDELKRDVRRLQRKYDIFKSITYLKDFFQASKLVFVLISSL